MQIIGKHEHGYIVAMSEDELANVAGYSYHRSQDFTDAMREIGAYEDGYRGRGLREGVEIPVAQIYWHLQELRRMDEQVRRAAGSLRGLADLMDGALPSVIAPDTYAD